MSGETQRFMSQHQMSQMLPPPYFRNFAPSDFYLFPMVKNRLERIHTVDEHDLFETLLEVLQVIPVDELERVFPACIDRVLEVNEGSGDCIA
jgi:hypothetical protein